MEDHVEFKQALKRPEAGGQKQEAAVKNGQQIQ